MEAVENKDKYLKKETRGEKTKRLLRKFIWVFPVLVITIALTVAYFMLKNINTGSSPLKKVEYEAYVKNTLKGKNEKEKEDSKLENYKKKIRKNKDENFNSRYSKIISGKDIIGGVKFGEVIPADNEEKKKPSLKDTVAEKESEKKVIPEKTPSKRIAEKKVQKKSPPVDTVKAVVAPADTVPPKPTDPFNTVKSSTSPNPAYIKAFIYGDQEVIPGGFIRLRLGEDITVNGEKIPKNTVFNGVTKLNRNKINIEVNRINRHDVDYTVFDQDYSKGIIIPASKAKDVEEALNQSAYDQSYRGTSDIPYEVIKDVAQNVLQKKKRKQAVLELQDGQPVFINNSENSQNF